MILETFVCGRARSNTYLLAPQSSGPCVIVDAGPGSAVRVSERVAALDLTPAALLLTHGHPDHVWCAREVSAAYGIPAYVHAADLRWFDDPATGGRMPGIRGAGRLISTLRRHRPVDLRPLDATLEVAGLRVEPLHTPGHTPGSSCLVAGELCFSGDTIFAEGLGPTFFPGGSSAALRSSVQVCLDTLADDVRLLPGHGPSTTMGGARGFLERYAARRR